MLRWLFLLILLANSLLFFWYAQKYHFAPVTSQPDFKPSALRLPSEISPSETLEPRPRECASFAPLASDYEAARLEQLLSERGFLAKKRSLPPVVDGVSLDLPLPADAEARINILDELARAGWVPETRDGALVLGRYSNREAASEVQASLPSQIASRTRVKPVMRVSSEYAVETSYLIGYEISSEIKQLITQSWPGVIFQKNVCEGVATPQIDQ